MQTSKSNCIDTFSGYYKFLCLDYTGKYPVRICEIEFRSATNAYEAFKLELGERNKLANSTPATAIKVGTKCELPEEWDSKRDETMFAILLAKFQPIEMAKRLVATKDKELIARNNTGETYWGVDATLGGKNRLGELLMEVRDYYKNLIEHHVWIYA